MNSTNPINITGNYKKMCLCVLSFKLVSHKLTDVTIKKQRYKGTETVGQPQKIEEASGRYPAVILLLL